MMRGVGRLALVAIVVAAIGALAVLVAVATPSPSAVSSSTNACSSCHSGTYTMYVRIDSYSVPASVGSDAASISVVVSVTGNEGLKNAAAQSYYVGDLTVSAASKSGLVTVTGSPKSYASIKPEYSQTVTFSIAGKGSGSDTITFTAKLRPKHNSGDTTRTITATAAIAVAINVPPVLSAGAVSPASGSPGNVFTFTVSYQDSNGDAPSAITMTLDGTTHDMAPADGAADTIVAGETYTVSVPGATVGEGTAHTFSFSASDGRAAATGDVGSHSGPSVVVDHPPVVAITYPSGGQLGGAITVTGTASDPDATDAVDRVEVTVGLASAQVAAGTTGWSLAVDLSPLSDGPLTIRAVAVSGGLRSAEAIVDITVGNSVVNIPPRLSIALENGTAIPPLAWINGTVVHPEPSQGAPTVVVGLGGSVPGMAANVTQGADVWHWSILVDLSALPEGPVTVQAIASDPYTSSPVDARTLILTPPESDPSVTFDPLGAPAWGTVTLTGTAVDPDGTALRVQVSLDGGAAVQADVAAGRWALTIDAASLAEGEHTVAVSGTDGRVDVATEAAFTVRAPVIVPVAPTMGLVEPAGPVSATVGDVLTFRALFTPGDALGTVVAWALDGQPLDGTPVDGGTELAVELATNGSHALTVSVSHATAPVLSVANTWDISVADLPLPPPPVRPLTVVPVGASDIETVVGEVVIVQYTVVDGSVSSVQWTVDGSPVDGGAYLAYMPATQGLHTVGLLASDRSNSTVELSFRVWASQPAAAATPSAADPAAASSLSPLGAGAIGALAMLVVFSTAWAVGRTREATDRSRKHTASHQRSKSAKEGAEAPAPEEARSGPVARSGKAVKAAPDPKAAAATSEAKGADANAAPRDATPRSPRAGEGTKPKSPVTPPRVGMGAPRAPGAAPSVAEMALTAPSARTRHPVYEVTPIPLARPCLVCGGMTVFNQRQGAYWCHACAAFHPVDESPGVSVQWTEGGAS